MLKKTPDPYIGSLFVILGALCFSTAGTAQALAPAGVEPMVVGALRLLSGAVILCSYCLLKGYSLNFLSYPFLPTFSAVFGIFSYQLTFFGAVAKTGVAVGTIVAIGVSPIVAGLLGFLVLKEKPKLIWYFATIVGLLGMILLSLTGNLEGNLLGVFLAVLAGSSYSVYIVAVKKIVVGQNPEIVVTVIFSLAAFFLLPVFFFLPFDWVFTANGFLVVLHLGIVTVAVGNIIFLMGVRLTPVSTSVTLTLIEPLSAAFLGFLFLQEEITAQSGLGIILIFISIALLVVVPNFSFKKKEIY